MNTHADKTDENKTASIESKPGQQRKDKQPSLQIIDNRPETIALRKLQEMADNSPQVKQMAQLQAMANKHVASQPSINPKKENETGLPDNLKSGIENLSGYAMDAVKVHYNSSKPAQLNTHASAQGNDIHLASGQEKHLPHEAWHVEQQKQGRVNATFQMKEKVNINDNVNLEKEADLVGNKIPGRSNMGPHERLPEPEAIPSNQSFFVSKTIQAKWIFKNGLR
ncbi:MAG: DUF4157 domain-containing protein, partial [Planctomycetes bacterium]|nr:DUF4157 domain-containing protein [Planctomycetota bacterium]